MIVRLTILVAAIALAACQPRPTANAPVPAVAPAPPPIMMTGEAKPIRFAGLMPALRLGDMIGEARSGPSCARTGSFHWSGKLSLIESKETANAFNAELRKANYPVVRAADEPFALADGEPELLIAGRVTSLTLNYCYATTETGSGDNILGIEWQVFDLVTRRTVYKVTTVGRGRLESAMPYFDHRLFYDAMSDATRALLADARFHGLVAGSRTLEQIPSAEPSFRLHPRPPLSGTVARNMPDIQAATVTIMLAGGSHGSGFLISSDGYLLTNAHVVGDAKFVRVRLATGREIAGEAVLVNRVRDVALVKVAERGLTALPVILTEPQIGTDIYAVGTPLDPGLATTVTKGIVSAYRSMSFGRVIQGDVDIHGGNSGGPLIDSSGNVVGISVRGRSVDAQKMSIGVNFFIPIADALKGASIELADARMASPMRAFERPIAVALQPSGPRAPVQPEVIAAAAPAAPTEPSPAPSQQVAAVAPVAAVLAKRDGGYRTKFTANSINGRSYVDLEISIDGDVIRGIGRTRGGLHCRADGEIAVDGTAWINVACRNAGSAYLSWQLAGRFAAEKDGTVYVGRLSYANLNGTPGEAVFTQ